MDTGGDEERERFLAVGDVVRGDALSPGTAPTVVERQQRTAPNHDDDVGLPPVPVPRADDPWQVDCEDGLAETREAGPVGSQDLRQRAARVGVAHERADDDALDHALLLAPRS